MLKISLLAVELIASKEKLYLPSKTLPNSLACCTYSEVSLGNLEVTLCSILNFLSKIFHLIDMHQLLILFAKTHLYLVNVITHPTNHHHHRYHVPEGLGVFPIP